MYKEKYFRLCENANEYIKPYQSFTMQFDGTQHTEAERLFFTGETGLCYMWRTEPDYELLYRRIDDSLDTYHAEHDHFCLNMSGGFCSYPKVAYKKLITPFKLSYISFTEYTDNWSFGISVKAKDLSIRGYLRVVMEVRQKKPDIYQGAITEAPDYSYTISVPEGSFPLQELKQNISFPANDTASICFFLEGEDYSGEVYFESPFINSENGVNILPPFAPSAANRPQFNWFGQNLSHLEWPSMRIELNGKCIYDGEIFERCHRASETEIPIPQGSILCGDNYIRFTCTSEFHDAPGYMLNEIGLISSGKTNIVSIPENITVSKVFPVFVNGERGQTVSFTSENIFPVDPLILKRDGLNVIRFICKRPSNHIRFTLDGKQCEIRRCVEHGDDDVLTGTGDMVYINANHQALDTYIKWYLSEGIGNLLTIRPTYRWSGTRILNQELWGHISEILNEGSISYTHMLDGRELPGCNTNPPMYALKSDSFLGRQNHELDGAFSYWGCRDITEDIDKQMFHDLLVRMYKHYGDTMNPHYDPVNLHYMDGHYTLYRDYTIPHDMKLAAEEFIKSLRKNRNDATRHTGPTTLFKYFYQAGYTWTGAELLYSPTELTIAALRGAGNTYGGNTGVHLAVQWSTTPHDTISRYRRYRLALFISYIQGVHEINTEEGLWHLEEHYSAHHRFSNACQNHLKQQQDFYRFITTHTRTGRFYTPIAFLHGRYDGWRCFVRHGDVWGVRGMPFGTPEAGWDLLTYFYPKSILDACYRHNCPDEPIGHYSGTPFGNVDILPAEAKSYSDYRLLIAPGYNCACTEDMDKLHDYVQNGGVLVIGWPQHSMTTNRMDILNGKHTYLTPDTLPKDPHFIADTFKGNQLHICSNMPDGNVVLYTDSANPLVIKYHFGQGDVYFINACEYAGEAAVQAGFRELLDIVVPKCLLHEDIYASGDENVQFSVFNNPDGSKNIYYIATDWYRENGDGKGGLHIGKYSYTIPVPFSSLVKVSVMGDYAIYPVQDCNEVITLTPHSARVQGIGNAEFVILKNGMSQTVHIDLTNDCIQEISFENIFEQL